MRATVTIVNKTADTLISLVENRLIRASLDAVFHRFLRFTIIARSKVDGSFRLLETFDKQHGYPFVSLLDGAHLDHKQVYRFTPR